jgi:fucose permease
MKAKSGPRDLLLISFLTFAAFGIPQSLLGISWIYMQDTFHVRLDAIGILLSVATIGRLIATFTSGKIIGWMGVGRFMFVGSLLSIVGMLGYALLQSWELLLVAQFVWGVGSVAINNGINIFAAANYGPSRMNWLHATFSLGSAIAPSLLTFIVSDLHQSWQWSYLVLVAIQVVITVLIGLNLPRWEIEPEAMAARQPTERVQMRDTLRLSLIWLVMGMFFMHSGVQLSAGQLTNSLFVQGLGIDPKIAATWITVYWTSLTIGRVLTGFIVDRIGGRLLLRIATFLIFIGALMLWWNVTDLFSFVGLALMGLGIAPLAPTLVSATPERVGKRHTPNAIGFQFAAGAIGGALIPGLGAALGEHVGLNTIATFLVVVGLVTFVLHEALIFRERRELVPQFDRV